MSELAQLMEEPAGGANHGRASAQEHGAFHGSVRWTHLSSDAIKSREFAREGGWTIVTDVPGTETRGGGWQRAGGTTHRGVTHDDEYIDRELVQALIVDEFGFDLDQIHSVYRTGGRIPSARIALRDAIDARLLELANSGGNVDQFCFYMGLNGSTVDRALARARAKEDN